MTLYVYQRSLDGVLETPFISPNKEYVQSLMQADLNKMPVELHTTIDEDGTITYVETAENEFSKYWEIDTPISADKSCTSNEINDIIPVWNMLSPEWKEILPYYIEKQFTIIQYITYAYDTVWDKQQTFENSIKVYAGAHVSNEEDEDGAYCDCNRDDVEWRKVECKEHGEIDDLPFSEYVQGNTMFVHVIKDHCDDLQKKYPETDPSSLIAVHDEIIRLLYHKE